MSKDETNALSVQHQAISSSALKSGIVKMVADVSDAIVAILVHPLPTTNTPIWLETVSDYLSLELPPISKFRNKYNS